MYNQISKINLERTYDFFIKGFFYHVFLEERNIRTKKHKDTKYYHYQLGSHKSCVKKTYTLGVEISS